MLLRREKQVDCINHSPFHGFYGATRRGRGRLGFLLVLNAREQSDSQVSELKGSSEGGEVGGGRHRRSIPAMPRMRVVAWKKVQSLGVKKMMVGVSATAGPRVVDSG